MKASISRKGNRWDNAYIVTKSIFNVFAEKS